MHSTFYSHRERFTRKKKNLTILGIITGKQGSQKIYSQTASSTIKCLNAVIAKIMKVRPQDPSYMA
jgi:hypothetical protein